MSDWKSVLRRVSTHLLMALIPGLLLVILHGVIRLSSSGGSKALRLLRTFYPLILYTFFYTETYYLDGMFFSQPKTLPTLA